MTAASCLIQMMDVRDLKLAVGVVASLSTYVGCYAVEVNKLNECDQVASCDRPYSYQQQQAAGWQQQDGQHNSSSSSSSTAAA